MKDGDDAAGIDAPLLQPAAAAGIPDVAHPFIDNPSSPKAQLALMKLAVPDGWGDVTLDRFKSTSLSGGISGAKIFKVTAAATIFR